MALTIPDECRPLQDEVDATHKLLDHENIPLASDLPGRVQLLIEQLPGAQMQRTLDQLSTLIQQLNQPSEGAGDDTL